MGAFVGGYHCGLILLGTSERSCAAGASELSRSPHRGKEAGVLITRLLLRWVEGFSEGQ